MANYEIITMRKGQVTTVDSFIKNFNAIGANMKALAVSAFNFLTSEDKELKKDFQIRVTDELGMTKATLSYLKTAGWLYTLDDRFSGFAYTNVIYFKKAIEHFTNKHQVEANADTLTTMFREIATLHNSTLTDGYVESLIELSQKELNNLINKYVTDEVEVVEPETTEPETSEPDEVDEVDEAIDDIVEGEELHRVEIYSDDYENIMEILRDIRNTPKMGKSVLMDKLDIIYEILEKCE